MDTRTKIVPLDEIDERLENRAASWISGHFDPLMAEHIPRIKHAREPGRLLVVKVTNPAQPLLGQRARAELVAALALVDFVVLGDGEASTDADVREHFIEHVLQRHHQETR